jgi:hypothetical protein
LLNLVLEKRGTVWPHVDLEREDIAGRLAYALYANFVSDRDRVHRREFPLQLRRTVGHHTLPVDDQCARMLPLRITIELYAALRSSLLSRHVSGTRQKSENKDAGKQNRQCAITVFHARPHLITRRSMSKTRSP